MRCQQLVGAAVVAAGLAVSAVDSEARATMRSAAPRLSPSRTGDGSRRGRPRKFDRPSRAVTLTLPEDVIATLQAIDTDLSRAVVRAMRPLGPPETSPLAEVASYGNRSVIVVPRSRTLRERTGVELIPIADGRALISMDERISVSQFELRLMDAIADPLLDAESRALFAELVAILGRARKDDGVDVRQRHVIILHRRNGAAVAGD